MLYTKYLSVFNIEKYLGTPMILFRCAYRANNLQLVKACRNTFTKLFHINQNPNYLKLEMYTQYLELKMQKNNPELADYLRTRLFCNKTRKPYKSEPYDELHEEFNRRGMRFQNNKVIRNMVFVSYRFSILFEKIECILLHVHTVSLSFII